MNAIFKVIWNISLNVWVAVGEFAKGKQKSKTTCAIPPSQHTSAVINKFSFPRLGFLAIAIIGVLGGAECLCYRCPRLYGPWIKLCHGEY
ncbi:ESPR domain-containing protein [Yersinia wautersii]